MNHVFVRRLIGIGAVVSALFAVSVTNISGAHGMPVPVGATTAAGYAGYWIASQVTVDGYIADANAMPASSSTVESALALAVTKVEGPTFFRMVAWLKSNVNAVTNPGGITDAGQIGLLLLVVVAAHEDPTNFGGANLVQLLSTTLDVYEPGLYGSTDPTYDGVFRQSMALVGLHATNQTIPTEAIDWLVAQQCVTIAPLVPDPVVTGGWMSYRAPGDPCIAGDSQNYVGVDTNSSAFASTALAAISVTPRADPLSFFAAMQNATGGWGFLGDLADDPSSDALVIQALATHGESPTSPRWTRASGDPMSSLLGFQLGCDAPVADQGAFTFPGTDNAPNLMATEQAVWGAIAQQFAIQPVTFSPAPVPCQTSSTTTTLVEVQAGLVAGEATPVAVVPALTG